MNSSSLNDLIERQLLLQLGDRLKRLRKAQGIGTVDMAKQVGISRTTLAAVEAGDPAPSIGTYLKVMSVLGVSGELALLAGDVIVPPPQDSASARSKRGRPVVQVTVTADDSKHRIQDLQSLALHEEAIRLISNNPDKLMQAKELLDRWIQGGPSRSKSLWLEWQDILRDGKWRTVVGRTRRAQELRQASPLTPLLPEATRRSILDSVSDLKKGVELIQPGGTAFP
jgi:transcriptional regulator with XRE-family HTH domain